jgi:uncharacterized protein YbcI
MTHSEVVSLVGSLAKENLGMAEALRVVALSQQVTTEQMKGILTLLKSLLPEQKDGELPVVEGRPSYVG